MIPSMTKSSFLKPVGYNVIEMYTCMCITNFVTFLAAKYTLS